MGIAKGLLPLQQRCLVHAGGVPRRRQVFDGHDVRLQPFGIGMFIDEAPL